jgi:glycosyltransferase involved in cell wall biosynthesis
VSFNSAATIRHTIESVLSQDYPAIEYIVVDGGSKDGTVEIVKQYARGIAVLVSEPDKGMYDAMNKGIRLATGDVVGVLNSDDIYADNHVVRDLIAEMSRAGSDSVFADLVYVDAKDTSLIRRHYTCRRWHPKRFRFGWMPAHPTFLAKRDLYRRYGLFSLEYQIAADFELLVRFLHTAKASYAYLPRVVVRMRLGGLSTRGAKYSWLLNREIVRACRSNGVWTILPIVLLKLPGKLMEIAFRHRRVSVRPSER